MKGKVAAPVSVGNLVMLPVDDIGPHPKNPRDDFDVDPLAESLAEYRLLSPILARPLPEGSATAFQIVAGHRRWMAAKKNGWPFIFALLCELNDQQALELLAAENQHRKNLNDIELAQLVKTLHDPIEQGGAGWTDEKIASYFRKKTPSWANNMRRVLQLPNEILDHVRKGLLPISSARLLIPYQRDQPTAFARIVADILAHPALWDKRANFETRAAAIAEGQMPEEPSCRHSSDFTSIVWFGKRYEFTKAQARAIGLLWAAWEKGNLGMGEETIGESIGSSRERFRLRDLFRRKGGNHPAWNTIIKPTGKGKFQLRDPEAPK